ncbi:MAG: cupin domain-containing protein [Clostridia bacterium]|nr:cupin domain-containing protein [Clostridia bacterium]MBT7122137.1 cupin domain-containing protein [Clostridia bacterium]
MCKEQKELPINHSGPEDFRWHRSKWLTDSANASQFDVGIVSLDPDRFSYPYHFHYGAEELFVILSGSAILRTPEGFQEVSQGDVIFFETGATGAHQLYNHTDTPCQYVDLYTDMGIDVCEYPDSGKINAIGENLGQIHFKKQNAGYFEGEENVREKWKGHLTKK